MTHNEASKKWYVQTAVSYLGTPYVWGGDDPSGFDCSGFVLECLKTAGLVGEREDHTADSLMRKFQASTIDEPCEGALLFTLNDKGVAVHVVICLDQFFQIGANGGTSNTADARAAWRDNAYVKIRPIRMRDGRQKIIMPIPKDVSPHEISG